MPELMKNPIHASRSWSSPWWRRSGTLAVVWSALLLYGGLVPYDVSWSRAAGPEAGVGEAMLAAAAAPLRWYVYPEAVTGSGIPKWAADLVMNGLLFAPLGILWMLSWRPRLGFNLAVGVSALLAFLLSWSIESAQAFSTARVSALNDVMVNTLAAVAGALVAWPVRSGLVRMSLTGYRWLAPGVHASVDVLRSARRTPSMLPALAAGLVLVGLGMTLLLAGVIDLGGGIPFAEQWRRSYDAAAVQMLTAALGYGVVGLLAIALVVKPREQRGWMRALLVVGLLAFGYEVARASTLGVTMDFTLPLMALGSTLAVMALCLGTIHAVRLACRRRSAEPVERERRRRSHDYGFRIGV